MAAPADGSDMDGASLTLRRADDDALPYVERLLEGNGLPAADVRAAPARFYVGYGDGTPVGVGGVERHGHDGLLRSVVVEPSARGDGVGTALCAALEAEARAAGIEALYLLTTTAAGFFDRQGYREVDRAEAPAAVRATAQFAELCPASATCMHKSLARRDTTSG